MKNTELDFSLPALRYAVEMCEANPGHRVAVVIKNPGELLRARDVITDHLDMTQYAVPQENNVVMWRNGSSIRFVYQDDTTRHYHFTLMLLSPSLDEKERERAIRRWMR